MLVNFVLHLTLQRREWKHEQWLVSIAICCSFETHRSFGCDVFIAFALMFFRTFPCFRRRPKRRSRQQSTERCFRPLWRSFVSGFISCYEIFLFREREKFYMGLKRVMYVHELYLFRKLFLK